MELLIDFALRYFMIILLCVLIGLVTLVASIFVKKRVALINTVGCLAIVVAILLSLTQYTSFAELYSKQLNEKTDVQSVVIHVGDRESITVENKNEIDLILADLSDVNLKKDPKVKPFDMDYYLEMIVRNQIGEKHFSTEKVYIDLDENHINSYRVLGKRNHLKTIESLVKGE
ncbi:hypothetical protein [Bacillus sp. B-jedd]|uniref:hypothetical protein n=1 Tax=Bacillus sp. B-jedd TaxID=1476857 RepID=UPI0005155A14|nr:hypothetical protein [Bacillus sp. B-jedd]CEG28836.1 hypothetical protein BN1002_03760 [Bacillus sp. B-jedd]